MSVLRMIDATFRSAIASVGPLNVTLEAGEGAVLACETSEAASITARLAGALIKATTGTVLVSDFDPRVQPVQVKRLIGFVPFQGANPGFKHAEDYFRFRADLWEIERDSAVERGRAILEQCPSPAGPYALALAAALIRPCALFILDRPGIEYLDVVNGQRANGSAIFATHVGPANSAAIERSFVGPSVAVVR